jgi:hypothetical protein
VVERAGKPLGNHVGAAADQASPSRVAEDVGDMLQIVVVGDQVRDGPKRGGDRQSRTTVTSMAGSRPTCRCTSHTRAVRS